MFDLIVSFISLNLFIMIAIMIILIHNWLIHNWPHIVSFIFMNIFIIIAIMIILIHIWPHIVSFFIMNIFIIIAIVTISTHVWLHAAPFTFNCTHPRTLKYLVPKIRLLHVQRLFTRVPTYNLRHSCKSNATIIDCTKESPLKAHNA